VSDVDGERGPARAVTPRVVLGAVLAVALILLIVQNTATTKVEWLVFQAEQPLWVVLLGTAAVALLIGELVGGVRRRRRRRAGEG
jgi:uncharacterized integral membrane protein